MASAARHSEHKVLSDQQGGELSLEEASEQKQEEGDDYHVEEGAAEERSGCHLCHSSQLNVESTTADAGDIKQLNPPMVIRYPRFAIDYYPMPTTRVMKPPCASRRVRIRYGGCFR